MAKIIGIDLGGTTAKVAILTVDGQIETKWEVPTVTEDHGAQILPNLQASIEAKLAELQLAKSEIKAIGMGVPAPVQPDGMMSMAANLGGFGGFNVAEKFSSMMELPVILDNDANVAALGEMWQGGAKGAANVVMITLGTGVGGGVIADGGIIRGFAGAGGEIGHMPVVSETDYTFTCGCGKAGCLETISSATGIVRVAKKMLQTHNAPTTLADFQPLTAKDVFDAAKNHDVLALQVVDYFAQTLAKAMGTLSVITNPEVFVIGGGVSKAGDIIIDTVAKYYYESVFAAATNGVKIELATLGNDAGVIGAAYHAHMYQA
ncbi:MAG: ROK family glucokinase [Culicoidibacterales bacterium]